MQVVLYNGHKMVAVVVAAVPVVVVFTWQFQDQVIKALQLGSSAVKCLLYD